MGVAAAAGRPSTIPSRAYPAWTSVRHVCEAPDKPPVRGRLFTPIEMSPRPSPHEPSRAAILARQRVAAELGTRAHEARMAQHLTLDQLAGRAGLTRASVHGVEAGRTASLVTYARIATALSLRLEADMTDSRPSNRTDFGRSSEDFVHAAMGELEAVHLGALGLLVRLDEPYQHYQFAGRADLVSWHADKTNLLHIKNKTRVPNVQEIVGTFTAKRAYLGPVLAERLGMLKWRSETHVL